jgi:hypothetical protein
MTTAVHEREPDYLGLLAAGYVLAFAFLVGGVVMAFVLSERRTGHAVAMAFLSVLVGFFWFWLVWG